MRRCDLCGERVWLKRSLTELTVTDGNDATVMMSINHGERCERAMVCRRCVKALLDRLEEDGAS